MTDFTYSLALVIGIDAYEHGILRLTTAVNDATRLGRSNRSVQFGQEAHLASGPASSGSRSAS